MAFLIDSNVILDVVTEDKTWFKWSSSIIAQSAEAGKIWINPVIYAEVSVGFSQIEELDHALPQTVFRRAALPYEAAFLAGKCFLKYRRTSGAKTSPLPDFYIGAHAAVENLTLITRDLGRFHTYFPKLKIICP